MEHGLPLKCGPMATVVEYREFAACEALREYVCAFFSFSPPADKEENQASRIKTREVLFDENDSFCSPVFADSQVSIIFPLERTCSKGGRWRQGDNNLNSAVIGPMNAVGRPLPEERPEMVGVYLRPGRSWPFTGVPAIELTDLVTPLDVLRLPELRSLPVALNESGSTMARIDLLERALVRRLRRTRQSSSSLKLSCIVDSLRRSEGRLTVERLAKAAGISRQHLTRIFRENVGLTPKRFARLARFHSGLIYAGRGKQVNWAQAALDLGYSDQSHMIAEFREFSSLTPDSMAQQSWFHPFIERAREVRRSKLLR